jgi:hypothetical protein
LTNVSLQGDQIGPGVEVARPTRFHRHFDLTTSHCGTASNVALGVRLVNQQFHGDVWVGLLILEPGAPRPAGPLAKTQFSNAGGRQFRTMKAESGPT